MTDFEELYTIAGKIDRNKQEEINEMVRRINVNGGLKEISDIFQQMAIDMQKSISLHNIFLKTLNKEEKQELDFEKVEFFLKPLINNAAVKLQILKKDKYKEVIYRDLIELVEDYMNFGVSILANINTPKIKGETIKFLGEQYKKILEEFMIRLKTFANNLIKINNRNKAA